MKRLNKLASLLLAVSMVFSAVPAMAAEEVSNKDVIVNADNQGGSGNVPVTLNVGDKNNPDNPVLNFSVTVPTTLPIHVDGNGVVTVAGGANGPKIINRSSGPVKVEAIDIVSQGSWLLADWSANLLTEKVGTKKYALAIQGSSNLTTDVGVTRVDDNNGTGDTSTFEQIPGKGAGAESSKAFAYNAHIAPQATDVTAEIANVVFTIGWDEATVKNDSKVAEDYSEDVLRYNTETNTYEAKLETPILVKADIYYDTSEPNIALTALEDDGTSTRSMRKAAARIVSDITYNWSVTLEDGSAVDNMVAVIDNTDCATGTAKLTMKQADTPVNVKCTATVGDKEVQAAEIKFKGWVSTDEYGNPVGTVYTDFEITKKNYSKIGYAYGTTDLIIPSTFQDDDGWHRVTSIGSYAFQRSSLKTVKIPDSVTSIGIGAFDMSYSLTSATIPDSVKSIGREAFSGCRVLTSIVIPNGITSIEERTFFGCSELASATIPDSIKSIKNQAFYNCYALESIKIPDGVTAIERESFSGCKSLTSINIPNSVTKIWYGAFSSTSLTSVEIPNSVTSIGMYAFSDCKSLESINIPDDITCIESYTFQRCSSLSSIKIPNNVTSIDQRVFYDCSSLESIDVGDSVTNIGDSALYGCSKLTSINWKGTKYQTLSAFKRAFTDGTGNTMA